LSTIVRTIAEADEAIFKLLGAMAETPAGATALHKIGADAIEQLRRIKVGLLAAQPTVLSKASSPPRVPTLRKRSVLVDEKRAAAIATEARDRGLEAQRIAKHQGGPTRWLAPTPLHGRRVAVGNTSVYVSPDGFCDLHAGAGPEVIKGLQILGFRQCPSNPDAMPEGDADVVSILKGTLARPMVGSASLVDFLSRNARAKP